MPRPLPRLLRKWSGRPHEPDVFTDKCGTLAAFHTVGHMSVAWCRWPIQHGASHHARVLMESWPHIVAVAQRDMLIESLAPPSGAYLHLEYPGPDHLGCLLIRKR